MDIRSRLKNYGFWVSAASLTGIILQNTGLLKAENNTWDNAVTAILGILVALGIINNPTTNSQWYQDDKNS